MKTIMPSFFLGVFNVKATGRQPRSGAVREILLTKRKKKRKEKKRKKKKHSPLFLNEVNAGRMNDKSIVWSLNLAMALTSTAKPRSASTSGGCN